jgi:NADPH2:quinone reductase
MLCRVLKRRGVGVVATAGDARKRKIALASGAAVAVGYGTEEVLGAVREKAGDDLRAVYDGVGKATFDLSLEAVGRKGTVASFGNASGPVEPFTIR